MLPKNWEGGRRVQTNNVIAKVFDGIGRENVSGVEGAKKSAINSRDIFSNLLKRESNFSNQTKQSVEKSEVAPTYEDSVNSYDRYQYKKNQIESGKPIEDKISESTEEIEK